MSLKSTYCIRRKGDKKYLSFIGGDIYWYESPDSDQFRPLREIVRIYYQLDIGLGYDELEIVEIEYQFKEVVDLNKSEIKDQLDYISLIRKRDKEYLKEWETYNKLSWIKKLSTKKPLNRILSHE